MSTPPEHGDFLRYEPEHKILICIDCHYAIQKNAIGSHLLRHGIYREKRSALLRWKATLDLLDPDDVRLPPPTTLPIPNLPLITGYKCASAGCSVLCASGGRVRRHWSEFHGTNVSGALDETVVHNAHFQTFFQGNKRKYFEVSLPQATSELEGRNQISSPDQAVREADLVKMRYLQHFVVETSRTLPSSISSYWGIDVVARALNCQWLMCGVLGIAAYHRYASTEDDSGRHHLEQASIFFPDLFSGLAPLSADRSDPEASEPSADGSMGAQLLYLRRLCLWAQDPERRSRHWPHIIVQDFTVQSFVAAIRGCTDPTVAWKSLLGVDNLSISTDRSDGRITSTEDGLLQCLPEPWGERLTTLPFRMAQVLPNPDSPADFFATASSLKELISCFVLSFHAEDAHWAWTAMIRWPQTFPVSFGMILRREAPDFAALIVLAHWVVLVQRAERHAWFLSGSSAKLMREIRGKLPQHEAIQALVSTLLS